MQMAFVKDHDVIQTFATDRTESRAQRKRFAKVNVVP
jgi:hypothetical protein